MKKTDILKHLPLSTDRLVLRRPTLDDVDTIHAAMIARNDILRRYMSWSSDEGMSVRGVTAYISGGLDKDNKTDIPLIAVTKDTGDFVLATGIHGDDEDFTTTPTGWWIARGYEGQGYAIEAMRTLIDFSFNIIGTQLITTEYYEDNIRSKNLMERLGFQYTGTQPKAHICHLDGHAMDVHEYKLKKEQSLTASLRGIK